MRGPPETALDRERDAAQRFREFDGLNSGIAREVHNLIKARNKALRERLDASRSRLMQQVVLAIGAGGAAGRRPGHLAGPAFQAAGARDRRGWARTGWRSRSTSRARPTSGG